MPLSTAKKQLLVEMVLKNKADLFCVCACVRSYKRPQIISLLGTHSQF